jgi:hypothetical protein
MSSILHYYLLAHCFKADIWNLFEEIRLMIFSSESHSVQAAGVNYISK